METNKRAFNTVKEYSAYQVPIYTVAPEKGIQETGAVLELLFVRGSKVVDENRVPGNDGTLHEHIISVMIYDLKLKYAEFPSKETACAITHLQEAQHWLEERVKEREAQGVLGTYKPHTS